MLKTLKYTSIIAFAIFCSFAAFKPKPTLYLIGDSTVKNGRDDGQKLGARGLWGWGHFLGDYFDTTKINVVNNALGGTSSRTFQTKGLWESVLANVKPGDYVMMQFGHNDASPLADTARARGTIKGNGDESQEIDNPITKKHETVYTYGWYIRKYISDTKAKGAVPIVCSMIPRNSWSDGKIRRVSDNYGKWAEEAAKQGGAYFIDLNKIIADQYDAEGEEKVRATYFGTDSTHPIEAGAIKNAQCVVAGIKELKGINLATYLKPVVRN